MKIDPVVRDEGSTLRQILNALDHAVTFPDNISGEGSVSGQVPISRGPDLPPVWVDPATLSGVGGVTIVRGTFGKIDVQNGSSEPVVTISPSYVGQESIVVVGTVTTGTWNANIIDTAHGGTGAASFDAATLYSGGATVGTLPKIGAAHTLVDSLLSESGSTVTLNGALDVSGALVVSGTSPSFVQRNSTYVSTNTWGLKNLNVTAGTLHVLSLHYKFADTSGNELNAGWLAVQKKQEWTITASTRDAIFRLQLALNGALSERLTIDPSAGTATFADLITSTVALATAQWSLRNTTGGTIVTVDNKQATRQYTGYTIERNSVEIWFAGVDNATDSFIFRTASSNKFTLTTTGNLTLTGAVTGTTLTGSTRVTSPLFGTTSAVDVVFDRNSVTQLTLGSLLATFAGDVNVASGKVYKVNGTQVVGAQGVAVADASGGAVIDAEARAALNTLLARVRTHGLIAT